MPKSTIDTPRFSASLRNRGMEFENRRIHMTNFKRSEEAKEFKIPPNCDGFGRIHHFRRDQPIPWPENPLPIDPAAKYLGICRPQQMRAEVFQNAICSWRCWSCFVGFDLLSAKPQFSECKSAEELLELYLAEQDRPALIDLSGGQPDLVPEWTLWFIRALSRRGLQNSVYLWSDDNLSNDYLWRFLKPSEIMELVNFKGYGRVGCFKGFDTESFTFNTKGDSKLFEQQFVLMRRLVRSGFDVYAYATFTSPTNKNISAKMSDFIDQLQERVHPVFPLRTVPLRISVFTPTATRIRAEQERSLQIQELAVAAWASELKRRYPQAALERAVTQQVLD